MAFQISSTQGSSLEGLQALREALSENIASAKLRTSEQGEVSQARTGTDTVNVSSYDPDELLAKIGAASSSELQGAHMGITMGRAMELLEGVDDL